MEEKQTKKESKFKEIKRRAFMSITRKQSTKEYNEMIGRIEKETGEKPNIEIRKTIRHQIAEKNAKKAEGRAAITAAIIVLGGSLGFGTVHALNEGSGRIEGVTKVENGENIDTSKVNEEVIIDSPNQEVHNIRDRYKVAIDHEMISRYGTTEVNLKELYEIKDNVTREVEELENEEGQILNYLKEEYAKEYNKTHEEKISVENITFYRSNNNIVYIDKAINGEEINRVCSESYARENGLKQKTGGTGQIINIRINGKVEEIVIGVTDHFERAYSEREEVQEIDENSILERMGNVINAGIEYAHAEEDYKPNYKMKLINEMVEYREEEFKKNIKAQLPMQKDFKNEGKPNDFEIGE